jgi:hypothetical protein
MQNLNGSVTHSARGSIRSSKARWPTRAVATKTSVPWRARRALQKLADRYKPLIEQELAA